MAKINPIGKLTPQTNVPVLDFSKTIPVEKTETLTPTQTTTFKITDPSYIFGVGLENGHGKAKPDWMLNPTLEALGFDEEIITILRNKSIASLSGIGFVKSSLEENYSFVHEDGTMELNSLDVMKLTQREGDTLIMNGGKSNGN